MTFKVGDEVTLNTRQGARAVVEYGPYGSGDGTYLVKLTEGVDVGDIFPALAYVLKAAPLVFRAGDRVAGCDGVEYIIVAGPFTAHDTWYVVRAGDGKEHPHGDSSLTLVSRALEGTTYEHDGVTYDLTAKYLDKDGDTWRFDHVRRDDVDGSPEGVMNDGSLRDTLARVVRDYSPLTKI